VWRKNTLDWPGCLVQPLLVSQNFCIIRKKQNSEFVAVRKWQNRKFVMINPQIAKPQISLVSHSANRKSAN
jgi:hypothetical protein